MSDLFQELNELLDKTRSQQTLLEREQFQSEQRNMLRDFSVQLREAQLNPVTEPIDLQKPSFLIGPNPDFKGAVQQGPIDSERGHMSPVDYNRFMSSMSNAAQAPDVASRDRHTQSAAKTVAQAVRGDKGADHASNMVSNAIGQLRSQVVYNFRQIGESLGLGQISSAALGYSLERALEVEGIKAVANKMVDKVADSANSRATNSPDAARVASTDGPDTSRPSAGARQLAQVNAAPNTYSSSTASTSAGLGMRHQMEQTFNSSMNKLADMGLSRDAIKGVINKSVGKLMIVSEVMNHKETLVRSAQVIAGSESTIKALASAATDAEVRKAVGTITLAAGETAMPVSKGAGSVAVLAGSAIRGDSVEDMGRHAVRAAAAVVGGAVGGVMGAGALSIPAAVLGAELGARAADYMLGVFDRITGRERKEHESTLQAGEVQQSMDTLAMAGAQVARESGKEISKEAISDKLDEAKSSFEELTKDQRLERELSMGRDRG